MKNGLQTCGRFVLKQTVGVAYSNFHFCTLVHKSDLIQYKTGTDLGALVVPFNPFTNYTDVLVPFSYRTFRSLFRSPIGDYQITGPFN